MRHKIENDTESKPINLSLLKRLLYFLKPYMKFVVISLALAIIVSALSPLRPYLTKIAIDEYIGKSDWPGLVLIISLIIGILAFHGLLQFLLTYMMQWVGQKVLYDIRVKLFDHIQALSLKFYDKNPVGRLVTRVTNDVEVLNELFSSGVVMIVADVLLVFWIIGFMFYTNVYLAVLTLCVLPFLLLATIIFRNKIRVTFQNIRQNVARMNSFLNEFISGIFTVKIFTQEQNQNKIFDEINVENKNLWVKTISYYAVFFPTVEMLSALALAVVLWYTAGNILNGVMTVGTLVAFLQYAEMFFRPIRDLTEKYTTLQSAMAASERIFNLFDNTEFLPDSKDAIELKELEKGIEFKNVSFTYDDSKWVLKDVSFKVNKGETVAIVGATGAGKTSIISLLCRFYNFQGGEVLIDGKDIRGYKQASLRSKIALVMQDVFLFSRNIAENISLGKEGINKEDLFRAADALGAREFIEELPRGFDSEVMERGATLSSGQRQLIAFCRAFAANPEILILDEATSNIDSKTERLIEESLARLLAGRTSVVIAHRLSTIRRADRIVVLHHGEVRESGTHRELMELNGLYAKLYQLQFNGNGKAAEAKPMNSIEN